MPEKFNVQVRRHFVIFVIKLWGILQYRSKFHIVSYFFVVFLSFQNWQTRKATLLLYI